MTALTGLKTLFEQEAQPSPLRVADELARYCDARGSYKDDLAAIDLLNEKGYLSPFCRAAHITPPLLGETSAEKAAAARIGNVQIFLKLGSKVPHEDIAALKIS